MSGRSRPPDSAVWYGADVQRAFVATLALFASALCASPGFGSEWPGAHERIEAALRSEDTVERRAAALRLMELPAPTATTLVRRLLRDPDVEVRLHAARAALALGMTRAGDEVVSWLQETDPRLRVAGCEVVQAGPTPESVGALARVLSDVKPEVREAAARALGVTGMGDSVAPLLGRLDDSSSHVRAAVVRALGRLGDSRAAVPLLSKLEDAEAEVRLAAARALGALREPRAASALEVALGDKDPGVVLAAVQALGRLGTADAVPALSLLLEPEGERASSGARTAGPAVRRAAVRALAKIGNDDALLALTRALEVEGPVPYTDETSAPVRHAFVAIGPRAESSLIRLLERGSSARAGSAAALALALIATPASRMRVADAIVSAARRRAIALESGLGALERLGERSALSFVVEHFESSDTNVRRAAIGVATALLDPTDPDGRVIDLARVRLEDPALHVGERAALVRMLGRTGTPRAVALLLSLVPAGGSVRDASALRAGVFEALGDLGFASAEGEAALLAGLSHSSERVRVAAARALGRVGAERAALELVVRLTSAAEEDREALGLALSGALARSSEDALQRPLESALRAVTGRGRDAILEGLGRSPAVWSGAMLEALAASADPDDRRKVAEGLALRSSGVRLATRLLSDPDAGVRANAAWSLVGIADEPSMIELRRAATDVDAAVAGNAVTALASAALRTGRGASEGAFLCSLLDSPRAYVVRAALRGLTRFGGSCEGGWGRRLLATSRSATVREAAAEWLATTNRDGNPVPAESEERRLDRLALVRCAEEERDSRVARRCEGSAGSLRESLAAGGRDVHVFVVPDGGDVPGARAPFALLLPSGDLRLGRADRRGVVFVRSAPVGEIALAVPAPLAP